MHRMARRSTHRRRLGLSLLVLAALVGAGTAGVRAIVRRPHERSADQAAAAFAAGWTRGTLRHVPFANTTARDATASYSRIVAGLGNPRVEARALGTATNSGRGVARIHVRWSLAGAAWSYTAKVALARRSGSWAVRWEAADVNPRLRNGDRLELKRLPAPRGQILGRNGSPLVKERPVVDVGVEPAGVRDVKALTTRLSLLLGVDASSLAERIRAAKPHAFVDVITLRRAGYQALRSRLHPLAGTVFMTGELPLAPTRTFARALLGWVGPATAEQIHASHGRLHAATQRAQAGARRASRRRGRRS
jgi:hypothetical protein